MQRRDPLERGSSVVTFVVALPLLLLFLFAVVDLGRTVFLSMALNDAAYAACRAVSQHPAGEGLGERAREAALVASPALGGDGLRLEASVRFDAPQDRAYTHRFYNAATGSFDERASKTTSQAVEVTLELAGSYLTPLGTVLSQASGTADGRFAFQTQVRGFSDATVKGGAW